MNFVACVHTVGCYFSVRLNVTLLTTTIINKIFLKWNASTEGNL